MVQGALKGKDESEKVGVPRGHPGERGPWGQEEEGCTEERVQEGGVALVCRTHLGGVRVSRVSCSLFWEGRPHGLAALSVWWFRSWTKGALGDLPVAALLSSDRQVA